MNLAKINIPLTIFGTLATFAALTNYFQNVNISALIGVFGLFCLSYGLDSLRKDA